jgi:hypothetical protein
LTPGVHEPLGVREKSSGVHQESTSPKCLQAAFMHIDPQSEK